MMRPPHSQVGPCHRMLLSIAIATLSVPLSAAEMRYDIKPDQVVPYRVTIVAETPAEKDTMSGIIAFTGKKSETDQFTVEYRGGLVRKKQAKATSSPGRRGPGGGPRGFPGRPGGGRPGGGPPRSPMSRFGGGISFDGLTQTTNTLVLDRKGELKSLTGDSQLPLPARQPLDPAL